MLQKSIMGGVPVIVLQRYLFDDPGGHFRVVYGFNSTHIFTKDPWGRGGQPEDFILTYADFTTLWHYTESAEKGPRFQGVSAVPWRLTITPPTAAPTQGSNSQIGVFYTYESPFASNAMKDSVKADRVILEIQYDPTIWLAQTSSIVVSTHFSLGETHNGSFNLTCLASSVACQTSSVSIRASGIVSGSVPPAVRYGSLKYPGYEYVDVIGSMWKELRFSGRK